MTEQEKRANELRRKLHAIGKGPEKKREGPKSLDFLNNLSGLNIPKNTRPEIKKIPVQIIKEKVYGGPSGKNGKDGSRGRDGVDGLDGRDGTDGRDGLDGIKGVKGDKGEKGDKGDKGDAGKDGEVRTDDAVKEVIEKIKKDKVLVVSDLKDGQSFIFNQTKYKTHEMMHGGGGGGSGGEPGGDDTNVQYNADGEFGGDSQFTWDTTTKRLRIYNAAGTHYLQLSGSIVTLPGLSSDTGMEFRPGGQFFVVAGTSMTLAAVNQITINSLAGQYYYSGVNGSGGTIFINIDNITAQREVHWQDKDGTVAYLSDITGGTPGGADTDIQFNDSGSFGGESNFTFDKTTKTMTIGVENDVAHIRAPNATTTDSPGGELQIKSGAGDGGGIGGTLELSAGDGGNNNDGGTVFIDGGDATAADPKGGTGTGGGVQITSGAGGATSGSAGDISLDAGNAQGTDSNGGNINISAGDKTGSGVAGKILLSSGNSDFAAIINTASQSADRTFTTPDASGTLAVVISGSAGIITGVYTPTVSAAANTDSTPTASQAQYMRVGETVTVSGNFTADPTLAATTTSFEITLPLASNIGAVEDVAGTAACGNIVSMCAAITGVVANDTAKVFWKSSDITSQTWSYQFTYRLV